MSSYLRGVWQVRPMLLSDLPKLVALDMSYESLHRYEVRRRETDGVLQYELILQPSSEPIVYDYTEWNWEDVDGFVDRLRAGSVFGAFNQQGACLGLAELELTAWNNTGRLLSLFVHRPYRRKGVGQALLAEAKKWAQAQEVRALLVETQANNVPAIRFYQRTGFSFCGLHDHYYSNEDLQYGEVAVFLAMPMPRP